MAITSVKDFISKAVDEGQTHTGTFRKTSAATTSANIFFDMSTTPGHPVTNYYASTPLVGATLLAREGIQHGSDQSPKTKYLKGIFATMNNANNNAILLDYLLYYPFIDGDAVDPQILDNTVTLPRYTDGFNVKAFVVAQGSYIGGAQFYITYTNQDGVSGRVSPLITSNTAAVSGNIINSGTIPGNYAWSLPLAQGDTGVRSVQEFTFLSANGGIFALVLVKELATISVREVFGVTERDMLLETGYNMPEIKDGAYLNYIMLPSANVINAPFYGHIKVVYG